MIPQSLRYYHEATSITKKRKLYFLQKFKIQKSEMYNTELYLFHWRKNKTRKSY